MSRSVDRLRRLILDHYDRSARELPWRRASDPYAIWISEAMLQQTRVETVIPYYMRWMERFPTLVAVARAELDDVLRMWKGLGYYARARALHRAAREVVEHLDGRLPADAVALRRLPGIGPYTAGAIASIAFGMAVPAVDGNVRRVISRLYDLEAPSVRTVWNRAEELVDRKRPGDFNQALMDLGATVCRPRDPRCDECPWEDHCQARRHGTIGQRPGRVARKPVPRRRFVVAVAVDEGRRVLVRRRPEDGLLGGLWEFPAVETGPETLPLVGVHGVLEETGLAEGDGLHSASPVELGTVEHRFSHFEACYEAYLFAVSRSTIREEARSDVDWIGLEGLDDIALPVAQQKIARLAGAALHGNGRAALAEGRET